MLHNVELSDVLRFSEYLSSLASKNPIFNTRDSWIQKNEVRNLAGAMSKIKCFTALDDRKQVTGSIYLDEWSEDHVPGSDREYKDYLEKKNTRLDDPSAASPIQQ